LISDKSFAKKILTFYDQHGRKDLPWQINKTDYSVWVSEIMLQQTQVKTVIPYYLRFMQTFPSIEILASAHIDRVLKLWEGLGYYSRARNLHACSKQVVSEFDGLFPKMMPQMIALPGIGESTAGAILSLAYGMPEAILDGNVKRVLARVFLVDGWYGKSAVNKKLWALSRKYTPKQRTGDFNQAMMDLGAGLCNRSKPLCSQCPLQTECKANVQNLTVEYPHRKPNKTIPTKHVAMILEHDSKNQLLLEKRPPSGIWGGLWSLPELAAIPDSPPTAQFKHSFSHYHLRASVYAEYDSPAKKQRVEDNPSLAWHNVSEISKLALPTPIKKFLYQHFEIKEK